MGLDPGLIQQPFLNAIPISGAGTYGPWLINCPSQPHWSFLPFWTGTIVGTWKIEGGAGADLTDPVTTPGKFTDQTSSFTGIVNPSGSAGDTEIAAVFFTAPQAKAWLVVASGTGTLTAYKTIKG